MHSHRGDGFDQLSASRWPGMASRQLPRMRCFHITHIQASTTLLFPELALSWNRWPTIAFFTGKREKNIFGLMLSSSSSRRDQFLIGKIDSHHWEGEMRLKIHLGSMLIRLACMLRATVAKSGKSYTACLVLSVLVFSVCCPADAKFILSKGVAPFLDMFLGRITFHTGINMFISYNPS